jgi:hypothetical protein
MSAGDRSRIQILRDDQPRVRDSRPICSPHRFQQRGQVHRRRRSISRAPIPSAPTANGPGPWPRPCDITVEYAFEANEADGTVGKALQGRAFPARLSRAPAAPAPRLACGRRLRRRPRPAQSHEGFWWRLGAVSRSTICAPRVRYAFDEAEAPSALARRAGVPDLDRTGAEALVDDFESQPVGEAQDRHLDAGLAVHDGVGHQLARGHLDLCDLGAQAPRAEGLPGRSGGRS